MEHNYLEINSKIEENRHSEGKHSCRKYIIPIRAESNKIWIFHYRCCPILSNSVNIYQFKLKESRKLHNERCNQHDRNVFSWWLEWKKISEMFEHYSNKIFIEIITKCTQTIYTTYMPFTQWIAHSTKTFRWNCQHHVDCRSYYYSSEWIPKVGVRCDEPGGLFWWNACEIRYDWALHERVNNQQAIKYRKSKRKK